MGRSSTRKRTTSRRSTKRSTRPPSTLGLLLVAGLLLLVYLYETGRLSPFLGNTTPPATQAPAASTGDVNVFFSTPSLVYPDKANRRGPSPFLQALLADITNAKSSVDLASFDFDIPELTDALLGAKQRGASVRLIVDDENVDTPVVAQETGRLQDAGIPVHFDHREPFMHNKFVVIDQNIAWTGSWNMTTNDTFRNNNNSLRFVSREIAQDYTHEFEQMFAGAFGNKKQSGTPYPRVQVDQTNMAVYFSPEDGVAQYVLEQLNKASRNIRFMTFSYTSADIAKAMIAKQRAGLPVEGVFESQNARGTGAKFETLRKAGVNVLEDGNCYILHHKVIIIDDRVVLTGSYNFTASAENDNDENLVVIDDPNVAKQYIDEFNRVYQQAQNPSRCG